ncbi:MAG: molecular chaperone HtpG, partial [Ruminococcaceae bacterium]|nr:molecular chaperone HtpG [Oscillospiraceae bacterium]
KMQEDDREKYEQFFKAFGAQLKWGIYSSYGTNKEMLQNLLLFKSSNEGKYVTLKEYVSRMKEGQEKIYFASGDTVEKIALLPQVESVIAHGYEVLYLTEDIDEFALQMLRTYSEKEFLNVCKENLDLSTDEEKEKLKSENEAAEELFKFMKESIGDGVSKVQFTNTLGKHPVSLSSEGNVSLGMEKALNKMPGAEEQHIKAEIVLQINIDHPLAAKLKELFESDKDRLATYSKILLAQARLVSGMSLDNPAEVSDLVCGLML